MEGGRAKQGGWPPRLRPCITAKGRLRAESRSVSGPAGPAWGASGPSLGGAQCAVNTE